VALNLGQVENDKHCGQRVYITNTDNGKSVAATVWDTCPGCGHESLDLSTGAFNAIGAESTGVLPIVWSFV
jgi:rare lipoprotein A (peptidoglycan hydrolase)